MGKEERVLPSERRRRHGMGSSRPGAPGEGPSSLPGRDPRFSPHRAARWGPGRGLQQPDNLSISPS